MNFPGGFTILLLSRKHFRHYVVQPRSQSSSAISDVTSPVKLVGKIRAWFQASSGHSDSANWPGYEAVRGALLPLLPAAVLPALASVRRQWWSQRCTLSYSLSQSKGLWNSEILEPLAHIEWLRKWNMAVFRKESVKASDRRYFFSVQRRWHG